MLRHASSPQHAGLRRGTMRRTSAFHLLACGLCALSGCGAPVVRIMYLSQDGRLSDEGPAPSANLVTGVRRPGAVRAASYAPDGRLAVAWSKGLVSIYGPGKLTPMVEARIGADGLAWAPDGERLAVVVPHGAAAELRLLNERLGTVGSVPLPRRPGLEAGNDRTAVSWNTSGTRIAVSASALGIRRELTADERWCAFFAVDDDHLHMTATRGLSDVIYIGECDFIATPSNGRTECFRGRLTTGSVATVQRLDETIAAACAGDGVAICWRLRPALHRAMLSDFVLDQWRPISVYADGRMHARRANQRRHSEILLIRRSPQIEGRKPVLTVVDATPGS